MEIYFFSFLKRAYLHGLIRNLDSNIKGNNFSSSIMEVTFIYSRVIIGIGVIMSVLDLFRKNPVSKLKLGDLQAEEIK
jgi:hypothetical protein